MTDAQDHFQLPNKPPLSLINCHNSSADEVKTKLPLKQFRKRQG
jgi:hypothetical protein